MPTAWMKDLSQSQLRDLDSGRRHALMLAVQRQVMAFLAIKLTSVRGVLCTPSGFGAHNIWVLSGTFTRG